MLARHGRSLEGDDDAPSVLADEQPALASLYDASAADRQLLGEAPGQATCKLVRAVREVLPPDEALADVGGVNVHAGTAMDGCAIASSGRGGTARTPWCSSRSSS